jgi:hypothetical protein
MKKMLFYHITMLNINKYLEIITYKVIKINKKMLMKIILEVKMKNRNIMSLS